MSQSLPPDGPDFPSDSSDSPKKPRKRTPAPPKTPQTRVPPDGRARNEALNKVTSVYFGPPQTSAPVSYYSPILIQCTLPHSDPKALAWKKESGPYTLVVASGYDQDLKPIGIPYGSFPRLVLAYIITRVKQTGECRVDLSSRFSTFLQDIGYTGNYKGKGGKGELIRQQLSRLLRANITWVNTNPGCIGAIDIKIAPRFELWFNPDKPDEATLQDTYETDSFIVVSMEFRNAIMRAPVPLRTDILKDLRKSPLALDVYMWLSYRLFVMQATDQPELSLSYGQLQEQFGTGIAEENYRKFRQALRGAIRKVAAYWQPVEGESKQRLNYDLNETRLVLYRSPLLIDKQRTPAEANLEEAKQIMASRRFDDLTLKKARQLAGNWDVGFLAGQYFGWCADVGVIPKNPRSHFLAFVKQHKERNGEG
jgi:hypothetical protein